ncbi:MAG: LysM peptidoglycan-binding domain-containing protein [Bacillota bacterium]|nr:LysM peptidoglycan-binding domain-containing protein [Bacillota bacterium]
MTDTARLRQPQNSTDEPPLGSVLHLASLLVGGVAVGLLLWWLSGPPDVPRSLPDWGRIGDILSGSYLSYEDVISIAASVGWLALGYLAFTVALRLAVHALARLTDGAAWARAALGLSDIVTLPIVCRIVDGAVAGSLLLSVWLRSSVASEAAASPVVATVSAVPQAAPVPGMTATSHPPATEPVEERSPPDRVISYTVVEGDNLWDISRRFYGDGTLYNRIFQENEGRAMTTGEPFTDPRLIRPGWVLDVPLPGYNVWATGSGMMYTVRPGDSLWRIAESLLGDGFRWTEIWELNQGREMGGGRRFTDADLILPGWLLELPVQATIPLVPPVEEAATASTPMPSPTAVPSATPETRSAPVPQPTAAPIQPPAGDGGGGFRWPAAPPMLAAAAGLATAGAAVLAVRRLVRRDGTSPLRVGARGGRGRRCTGDVGRVVLAARALAHSLAELGFEDVRVVLVREAERFLDFTLDCAPGDAEAIVRARYDLGRRLACAVGGEVVGSTRVRLKLSRFQRLAGLLVDDDLALHPLLLVPVGAADNAVHYLNLAAAGSAMVVGRQHETEQLLSAWLTTLAAICRPDELAFVPAGTVAADLGEMTRLPHFGMGDDSRERSVEELASELEEMIVARSASVTDGGAAVVALVGLSADEKSDAARLETILRRGPEREIYTVAVAEGATDHESARTFGARVVFGGSEDGSEGRQQDGLSARPGELALSVGHEPSLVLQPVEVRTELLRPLTRRGSGVDCEEQALSEHAQAAAVEDQLGMPTPDRCETPLEASEENVEADGPISPGPVEEESPVGRPPDATGTDAHVNRTARQPALLLDEEDEEEAEGTSIAGPTFTVRCFGSFQVETATGEVAGWTIQKARELLAYLIARGGTPVLRDEVAEALWPEGDRAQVEHLLSNAA